MMVYALQISVIKGQLPVFCKKTEFFRYLHIYI